MNHIHKKDFKKWHNKNHHRYTMMVFGCYLPPNWLLPNLTSQFGTGKPDLENPNLSVEIMSEKYHKFSKSPSFARRSVAAKALYLKNTYTSFYSKTEIYATAKQNSNNK